ncbi:hypothetical protein STRAU_0478 [Streptomyces aurantiacus JA 4570]|uniref:Uncharacterized protein n=1 Tax=Streptomyces aurantiacus JA 4570 TaxID=1286094 RepID=S3ZSW5_9ACTN|nr:hypothetical protein STRAU_0478 [Streptomyces aurantiacus JA 4570]
MGVYCHERQGPVGHERSSCGDTSWYECAAGVPRSLDRCNCADRAGCSRLTAPRFSRVGWPRTW